ncbi:DUF6276 family protein [Halobacteria archaeon AArc-curdl1]|uniref:DUF6276 family protein n=1 Tax=Natronosalvus hydrolyticus TaxID=2979988 RepID=A0AAP2Z962_9EURY|nr:DUF6276 family protein [Halobacteria archaeon AArc-curdl1]
MDCPHCTDTVLEFSLPKSYREPTHLPTHLRDETPDPRGGTICPHCLSVTLGATEDAPPLEAPRTETISDDFPRTEAGAVPFALTLESCRSLAMNRAVIERLLEATERAGVDPLLTLDRLLADPDIEPAVDLERRRHQLEQFLYD